MALESGTYINSLNTSNPASTDGLAQADDHLRLIKSTVKSTFPNVTGAVSATHTELNLIDGLTASTSELNTLAGITSSTSELNILDGVTASTAELNKMDGVTATTAELNYTGGVSSNIQTQLNAKQASNDILTDLAGLTQATNKIPYFSSSTAASLLDFKDEDNMSSNSASAIPSQQSVKAYVDASSSMTQYTSAATSISNNQVLTFSHGLGAVPSFVVIDAIAKTSNSNGWSNGDRVQMNQSCDPSGSNEGMGIRTDSSNVYVSIGENGLGQATFRSNGAGTILESSKWNIEVKAFLVG